VLEQYTKDGYRVIALATKDLIGFDSKSLLSVRREDVETKLTFLGFLVMENKLKPESAEVL
jgi:cation-transporting ATPase 13A3/4/5